MRPDEPVHGQFLLAHGGELRRFERRDDAVVRRDLAIVPGARALRAVELAHDRAQRGIGLEQAVENGGHFGKHALGQVAGVRAGVRRGLVRLVQGLGNLQGFLHVQPKLLGTHFLQGAQVERQRRAFADTLSLHRHDVGTARSADLLHGLLCDRLPQAAACVVGARIGWNPLRGESRTACEQGHGDGPVWYGHEARDLAVAVHNELERRGLYAADRQHAVVTRLSPQHREQPAQVHAHEPIRTGARQRRVVHRKRLGRRPQLAQCRPNGRIVERRQPQAFDGAAVAAKLHDLAGDQFALAVGIGGDNQVSRLRQERLDDLELRGGLRFDLDPPVLGNDGQLLNGPSFELLVVGLGRRRLHEMADAPGDRDAGTVEAAFTALRGAENPANVFALGGLLAQEQPHIRPSRFLLFMELLGSRMPSAAPGSSKQAACGSDRFHADEMASAGKVRGRKCAGREPRFPEARVELGGRWWSYPLGIIRSAWRAAKHCGSRPPCPITSCAWSLSAPSIPGWPGASALPPVASG
ncbi:hypothetical protein PAERUG_P52_2_London_26_VIM_2_02_13_04594 [Pseudomonas aeruginosa]|nr:hypothetical protein PAERUG_E15_London_28_01_14_07039 [Pseudomonas aeruginosa]CRR89192.1 hypothetical protein PAERUG_P52_2_London_26_VIM_2_02_13_04594 [Pseudomonas aeruginosa]